jgi:hypothetical protein
MKMRDSSSNQRSVKTMVLTAAMSHKKIAATTVVGVLALLTIPVAVGWQRAVQPVPTQNASSATAANEPASKDAQQTLIQPAQPSTDTSSSHVETSTTVNNGQGTTQLKVNGKSIAVPQNGAVSKTVPNPDGGVTNVNVQSNSTSWGSNSTQSITNVQSNSTSTSQSVSTYSSQ